MNNQRLATLVVYFNEEKGGVYHVNSGPSDPYFTKYMLEANPAAKEGLEKNGMGVVETDKREYMIFLPEESPYFNLDVLNNAMEEVGHRDMMQIMFSVGVRLLDLIKEGETK